MVRPRSLDCSVIWLGGPPPASADDRHRRRQGWSAAVASPPELSGRHGTHVLPGPPLPRAPHTADRQGGRRPEHRQGCAGPIPFRGNEAIDRTGFCGCGGKFTLRGRASFRIARRMSERYPHAHAEPGVPSGITVVALLSHERPYLRAFAVFDLGNSNAGAGDVEPEPCGDDAGMLGRRRTVAQHFLHPGAGSRPVSARNAIRASRTAASASRNAPSLSLASAVASNSSARETWPARAWRVTSRVSAAVLAVRVRAAARAASAAAHVQYASRTSAAMARRRAAICAARRWPSASAKPRCARDWPGNHTGTPTSSSASRKPRFWVKRSVV